MCKKRSCLDFKSISNPIIYIYIYFGVIRQICILILFIYMLNFIIYIYNFNDVDGVGLGGYRIGNFLPYKNKKGYTMSVLQKQEALSDKRNKSVFHEGSFITVAARGGKGRGQ